MTKLSSFAWGAFSWLAFALVAFLAVRTVLDGLWQGAAPFLAAAALCLPALRAWVVRTFRVKLHGAFYGVAALALVGIGVSLAADQQVRRDKVAESTAQEALQRRMAAQREAAEAEFRNRKTSMLAEAQRLAEAGDHAGAVATLGKFRFTGDPDLVRIHDASRLVLLRKEVQDGGPANERAVQVYAEIARLDPTDEQAKVAGAAIASRLAAEKARRIAKEQREQQVQGQFSRWDGSHPGVERAIKAQMKSPDSYKHVETRYTDSGADSFVVVTTFRGTNSFNAVVTSIATATVSPSGQVLSITVR